jgi:hypothetical protein
MARDEFRFAGETGTEGVYSWITGEPLSYTNWYWGEPNNGCGGTEDRGQLLWLPNTKRQGQWNDLPNLGLSNPQSFPDLVRTGYIVETPEPSTLILLAAGAVGFLGWAWRKRKFKPLRSPL